MVYRILLRPSSRGKGLMVHPLVSRYRQLALFRDSEQHSRIFPYSPGSVRELHGFLDARSKSILASGRPFFKKYDYSWIMDRSNFDSPDERALQLTLVDTL